LGFAAFFGLFDLNLTGRLQRRVPGSTRFLARFS
jgi:hypothetical protein